MFSFGIRWRRLNQPILQIGFLQALDYVKRMVTYNISFYWCFRPSACPVQPHSLHKQTGHHRALARGACTLTPQISCARWFSSYKSAGPGCQLSRRTVLPGKAALLNTAITAKSTFAIIVPKPAFAGMRLSIRRCPRRLVATSPPGSWLPVAEYPTTHGSRSSFTHRCTRSSSHYLITSPDVRTSFCLKSTLV